MIVARRRLDNLRIREVRAQVDDHTATHAAVCSAGTPVVRLADDATITRYVERDRTVEDDWRVPDRATPG
jgi:hypothetical protein